MATRHEAQREVSFAGDLRFIAGVLWSKAWLVALGVAAGAGLAVLYLLVTPKSYAARTVLQIEQEDQKVVKIDGLRSEDRKSVEVLKTYEQNIASPEVLLRVIHDPSLAGDPHFLPEVAAPRSENRLQEALGRRIDARIRRGTRLIDIVVQDGDPAVAQRIAALLTQEFVRWNFEARRETGQLASRFLMEEADRLKARLGKSEQALQTYKEQHEAVSLGDKDNIAMAKLGQLNQRLTDAKAERLKLEADCAELSKSTAHSAAELLVIPGIANAPAIAELRRSISEKDARFATLIERYKPLHPRYIAAKTELDKLKAALSDSVLKTADVLASQYQAAALTERKLEEALRQQQQTALELDQVSIPYTVLLRDADSDRALYDSVLTRLKETDITKDIGQDAIRVVARPLLPDRPVKPGKTLALGLGLVAGFLGGCGLAFATHAADRSLRTLHDAEKRLGLRPLGEIPRLPSARRRALPPPVLLGSDFAAAEAFRTLRTSLSFLGDQSGRRSFLFASAREGEGKTFCAINCAVAFAQQGWKTLLVDADFRRPQIRKFFFHGAQVARAQEADAGAEAWEGQVLPTPVPNLSVLDGGAGAGDSSGGQHFEQFMEAALRRYDRVVVDSAPIQVVSDTLLFARHVQAVCLVIRAGHTSTEDVERAAQRLAEAGAPPAGFVWNQAAIARDYGSYYDQAAQPSAPLVLIEPPPAAKQG